MSDFLFIKHFAFKKEDILFVATVRYCVKIRLGGEEKETYSVDCESAEAAEAIFADVCLQLGKS